jgi:CRISPR/Cas system CSM-associated protein Csm3 (group 7 of RAMP superfamily)
MYELKYEIELLSDAEPGSGFGTECINSLIPRDSNGKPVIPASHIKGLMLENLLTISEDLHNSTIAMKALVKKVFGTEGGINSGKSGLISLSDAKVKNYDKILLVTRTKINEFGIADDTSLRTTEAISNGTLFIGSIRIDGEPNECIDLLLKLALLSINAIGSSRNRGCGECRVTINSTSENTKCMPGAVLLKLIDVLSKNNNIPLIKYKSIKNVNNNLMHTIFFKLKFKADGPVCLPETPVTELNTIQSGFTISASAVQGMILHRINNHAPEIATECFNNSRFRTWPLFPVLEGNTGIPVVVPSTQRISKLKNAEGDYLFTDEIIKCNNADNENKNLQLKSKTGVLIPESQDIIFYKSCDMPRIITAHAVHNDPKTGRNLYTVESVASHSFEGIISLPENAAEVLIESLQASDFVKFGKARSVRGGGKLTADKISIVDLGLQQNLESDFHNRLFIAQSPLLIPDDWKIGSVVEVLKQLVKESGLGEVENASATITILFGWNSHGKGKNSANGRLRAERVIAPGSVFLLKKAVANLEETLIIGVGKGKSQGFGSILPHPGIATKCYEKKDIINSLQSSNKAGELGFDLWKENKVCGLSASQISYLKSKLDVTKSDGLGYLETIRSDRPARIWDRWKNVREILIKNINEDYLMTKKAVKVWHDLTVAGEFNDE